MANSYFSKFSENTDLSNFDHVIIGSGIGGLTLAAWLAKAGIKVAVLERHNVPGGFTHVFKRGVFTFDVGVHYVGNVGKKGSVRNFFDYISDNKLKWQSTGAIYDVVQIGDRKYELKAGKENFKAQLYDYFPNDKMSIDAYLNLIEKVSNKGTGFFVEKVFKRGLSKLVGGVLRKRFLKYAGRTTFDVVSELTNNKELIAVLCAQLGNYGLSPKYSSFGAHAIIINHYMAGGYYPVGGVQQISETICNSIVNNGGAIFTQADVGKIHVDKKRVTGLLVNNRFYLCNSVVSDVGVQNTFEQLLDRDSSKLCGYNLQGVEPSVGHLCLYIGLNKSGNDLNLPKHNVWYYNDNNYIDALEDLSLDRSTTLFSYNSFPSQKDAQWERIHPNKSTIQIITMSYYKWFEQFDDNRNEDYNNLKKELVDKMLKRLYQLYPQVKSHIELVELSTPLTTKRFSNYQHGEIYGLEHSPKRFTLPFLRPETRIKGLRLAGQDITLVGITGAMLSGALCATNILKMKSWKQYKRMLSNVPED